MGISRGGINPPGYVPRIMELLFHKDWCCFAVLWGH